MKTCTVTFILVSWIFAAQRLDQRTPEVAFCDLIRAPQQFSGKRIRVRGIYKYGFEIQRLDSPNCCSEREAKIWIEIESNLEANSLKLYRKFPEGMGWVLATFEGRFESGGPYGDGGYRLRLTVDKIVNLEKKAKASAHDPAWVPGNCGTSSAMRLNKKTVVRSRGAVGTAPSAQLAPDHNYSGNFVSGMMPGWRRA